MFHERTTHLNIDCHLVHDHLNIFVPLKTSKLRMTNLLTKPLAIAQFHILLSNFDLQMLHSLETLAPI